MKSHNPLWRGTVAALMSVALAACGGGGGGASLGTATTTTGTGTTTTGTGTGTTGTGTTTTTGSAATMVSLVASSSSMPADASTAATGVTIRAIVTDSNNVAVSGATVTFSADSGALTNVVGTTTASGEASAVLTNGGNTAPRTITVKASTVNSTTGTVSATPITVNVVAPSSTPTVAPGLGSLNGTTYTDGKIGTDLTALAAGGSAGLTVDIVDRNNANQRLTTSTTVSFTSDCVAKGLATITVTGTNPASSTGTSTTGQITATYVAQGCTGTDTIRATATSGSATLTASTTLTVQPATVGSINYVSATPTSIGIKGSGQPETSVVVFAVKDSTGGTVANKCVFFNLNTGVGGIGLAPVSAVTNSSGQTQTVVTSGSIATAVRVTATVYSATDTRDSTGACVKPTTGTSIVSQSEQLTISTRIPHQNGFSISAGPLNIEAFNRDNIPSVVSIVAADRFGNPVPDGTAISLITECGKIQSFCTTTGDASGASGTKAGICSANYSSGGRRETTNTTDAQGNVATGGRCTVLATAVGEESFGDKDGNGRYSRAAGDVFASPGDDKPEAFLDRNEDGARTIGNEAFTTDDFIDFNQNGIYDTFDGLFNGLLCDDGCGAQNTISVRGSLVIVNSTSGANIQCRVGASEYCASQTTYTARAGETIRLVVLVSDLNNNKMAAGTSLSTSAVTASVATPSSFTQADDTSIGPAAYLFFVTVPSGTASGTTGSVTISVTSPSGRVTPQNFAFVVA